MGTIRKPRVTVTCAFCGCSRDLPPWEAKKFRYCSKKCDGLRRVRPLSERLWEKIDRRGDDECWPWMAASSNGYGRIGLVGGHDCPTALATRIVYQECNGPLSDDEKVRHTCDNPPCCNPRHLLKGSQADNIADCKSRGRSRGHPPRLTDEEIDLIRQMPGPRRLIAERFAVSLNYISMLKNDPRIRVRKR
jgi:hypothetical protein